MDETDECKHGVRASNCRTCNEPGRPTSPGKIRTKGSSYQGRKTAENSEDYFGHSWAEWNEMRDVGVDILKDHAKDKRTTSYKKFWSDVRSRFRGDVGKSGRQVPQLLRHISEFTFDECGLLLTALVVTEGHDPHPSEGFFRLAARLGLLPDEDAPDTGEEWRVMTPAQRSFWRDQTEGLFGFFANFEVNEVPSSLLNQ